MLAVEELKSFPSVCVSICKRSLCGTASGMNRKGSDWIRLVFAHLFPLNSRAPIASGNFILDGKVQVSPLLYATYGVASSYTLIIDLAQLMGAPFFKTNGCAQSNCFSGQTLW